MLLTALNPLLTAVILLLAMAFGALLTLIVQEVSRRTRRRTSTARSSNSIGHSEEERKRRQDVVVRLMGLYSGVHSADALSDFLNKELERRHEAWRVHVPSDGPGEIYDLDSV